jgi:prepilin-type N-terminal cleavage/methylation domain-containing protein
MKRLWRNIYKSEKGFTLVELMIVIIILAVLTGIAVPSYLALRNRARESATESEMKNIATALELCQADTESYPADYTTITAYMNPIPTTDSWTHAYVYTLGAGGSSYTLESWGANGADDSGVDDLVIANGAWTTETGAY